MAIVAITGVMGSGKTYLSIKNKLVPFLKEGRQIVTSIAIPESCFDRIADYAGIPLDKLKEQLIVKDNDELKTLIGEGKLFFHPKNCVDALVQPGAVFMPDEAWGIAKKGRNTYDERFEEFVKMHRHYKDSRGRTVEIVLITQSLRQLNSDLTDVVELELKCKKKKSTGSPDKFTVAYHEGGSRSCSHFYEYKYDSAIFPLYKSHDGDGPEAVEHYDTSMSIFNRPMFKFLKYGLLPVLLLALYLGYSAFSKLTTGRAMKNSGAATQEQSAAQGQTQGTTGPQAAPAGRAAEKAGAGSWRIVASYSVGGLPVYDLVDEKGRYRTVTPGSVSRGAGDDVTISLSKEADMPASSATPWTNNNATYTQRSQSGPPK